ncbi:MAG: CBS domain-containing protein [Nanoarchaeota archaeon]|nr:CBS domain-containing protein [Nanoarchaeota archaeon]
MLVKDIMSKNIISVTSSDNVQTLISLMKKHNVHEIPIIDNKKLIGIIEAKRLTEKTVGDPNKTKVKNLKTAPPAILKAEQDLDSAAKLLLKTGLRALPVMEGENIIGIVSIHDIVNEISSSKAFRQTKIKNVMSKCVTISEDTDIGNVRVIMRDKNISRLPIVDTNGKIKGIVTTFDMFKAIKGKEKMGRYEMGSEMERMMQIPVTAIMNTKTLTATSDQTLNDVANLIHQFDDSGAIITTNGVVDGVIVLKDLLEFYVSGLKKEGIFYQIIGLDKEDSFETDTVNRMINDTIKKISGTCDINYLFIHVKKHNTGYNSRIKYSIRIRLKTSKKLYTSQAVAWDLRASVNDALTQLERMIFKEKGISKDRSRKSAKIKKSMRGE